MAGDNIHNEVIGGIKPDGRVVSEQSMRDDAINRFRSIKQENIIHGLGIMTDMRFLPSDDEMLIKGDTSLRYDEKFIHENNIKIFGIKEFMESGTDIEAKAGIIEFINKTGKYALRKLDLLHIGLADIKVIVIDSIIEDNFMIERIIEGNSYNHIIILALEGSKAKVFIDTRRKDVKMHDEPRIDGHENSIHANKLNVITDFVDIIALEKSDIQVIEQRRLSKNDVVYSRKNALLYDHSVLDWVNIDHDSRLSFIEQASNLDGDNSISSIHNILCGRDSEYYTNTTSEHTGVSTKSLIQNKSVLKRSKAVMKGLVKINPEARDSDGYQKTDILMLDDQSRAISLPDLKIHNNDVRCTHGSTITRLDDEKLFYLESRGLDAKESSRLLIEGFYDKILSQIIDDDVREHIRKDINEEMAAAIEEQHSRVH